MLFTDATSVPLMSPSSCSVQRWCWAACPPQLHTVPVLLVKARGLTWGQSPRGQGSDGRSVSSPPCNTLIQYLDCHIWPGWNPARDISIHFHRCVCKESFSFSHTHTSGPICTHSSNEEWLFKISLSIYSHLSTTQNLLSPCSRHCCCGYCFKQRKRRKLKHPEIQLPAQQIFVDQTIFCFSTKNVG